MSNKEDLKKSLEKFGWHLTNESIDEFLVETPNLNSQSLIKKALDCDLRNIGAKSLPDTVVNGKAENFEANNVLQLVKLRNIGAPKENEHSGAAPPMYKLTLTDGTSNCNCLAVEDAQNLNLNTPPGTKIFLTGSIKIKTNLLILVSQNIKVLGGHVDYLVNKWKLTKDLTHHVRIQGLTDTPPPPWVPFGTRQKAQVDTSKKVFEQSESNENEENTEFSEARKAILSEVMEAKAKITKTFVQQNIDKSQIITETKPQLSNVNQSSSNQSTTTALNKPPGKTFTKKGRKGKFRDMEDEEEYSDAKNTARPPTVSTLYDIFKTKLEIGDDQKEAPPSAGPETSNYHSRSTQGQDNMRDRRNRRQNPRFQQRQPQNQQVNSNQNKQVYNPDDFNFELGDSAKVKDSKNSKNELSDLTKEELDFINQDLNSESQNFRKAQNLPSANAASNTANNKTEFQSNSFNNKNNYNNNNDKPRTFNNNRSGNDNNFDNNRERNTRNFNNNNNNNNNNNFNNRGNYQNNNYKNPRMPNQQNFVQQTQAINPVPFQQPQQSYNYDPMHQDQQSNYNMRNYNQYYMDQQQPPPQQYYQQNNQYFNQNQQGNYYQNYSNNNNNNYRNNDSYDNQQQNRKPRNNNNQFNNNYNNNKNWDNSNRRNYQ